MDEPCSDFARENRHAMMEAVKEVPLIVKHISWVAVNAHHNKASMKSTMAKRSYTERCHMCGKECWNYPGSDGKLPHIVEGLKPKVFILLPREQAPAVRNQAKREYSVDYV